MRLELIIFLLILCVILYAKYGSKIPIPELGGVSSKLGLVFGSLIKLNEKGNRLELLTLSIALGIAAWFVKPEIYTVWVTNNGKLAAFIIVGVILWFFFKPPKRTWFLYFELVTLTVMAVFATLPTDTQESISEWRPWSTTPPPPRKTTKVPASTPQTGPRRVELPVVLAKPGILTEVRGIPENFGELDFNCSTDIVMWITHDSLPDGEPKDCEEPINLGKGLKGLRLWVQSKTARDIPIVVGYVPMR
jgi:hypothetical protein